MYRKLYLWQGGIIALLAFAHLTHRINLFPNTVLNRTVARFSNLTTDLKFRWRGKTAPKNHIVIVEVDSPSLDTLGRWPWRRDMTAYLVDRIFENGARNVGLDIIFSEPEKIVPEELKAELKRRHLEALTTPFDSDGVLAETVRRHKDHLILSWTTETACQPRFSSNESCPTNDKELLANLPLLQEKFSLTEVAGDLAKTPLIYAPTLIPNLSLLNENASHSGFANAFRDPDGISRKAGLLMVAGKHVYPSFPMALAGLTLGEDPRVEVSANGGVKNLVFERSSKKIPATNSGVMPINFRGPERTFSYISAMDVFKEGNELPILKDATVLVGVSAIALSDLASTPFDPAIPGVEVQANILDNILSADGLLEEGAGHSMILVAMIFLGMALSVFATRLESVKTVALFLGTLSLVVAFDLFAFAKNVNYDTSLFYVELLLLLFSSVVQRYLEEERQKKFLRLAFSRYVSPSVVESLVRGRAKLSLGGERKELTLLFTDIRGFSTFSEEIPGPVVAQFLNDYFDRMTEIVLKHGGTLDKFIGDALMAFWGAPLADPEHALHACQAAVEMVRMVEENREHFIERYGIDVHMGVGVNTGEVNVGNMGSEKSFSYTAIGDPVNVAARIEKATKDYGVAALAAKETIEKAVKSGGAIPAYRPIGSISVRGRKKNVEVVELITGSARQKNVRAA